MHHQQKNPAKAHTQSAETPSIGIATHKKSQRQRCYHSTGQIVQTMIGKHNAPKSRFSFYLEMLNGDIS
jgi:hypothetical protein